MFGFIILFSALYFLTFESHAVSKSLTSEILYEGEEVTIDAPIGYINTSPILTMTINGHGPYFFLLDTGSKSNFVTEDFVQELHLKEIEHSSKTYYTPSEVITLEQHTVLLPEGKIGNATLKNIQLHSMIDQRYEMNILKNQNIHGILGIYTFRDHAFKLDYSREKLTLSKKKLKNTGNNVFEFARRVNMPFIQMEINFDNISGDFYEHVLLDSGYFGNIYINSCNHPAMQAVKTIDEFRRVDAFGAKLTHHFAKLAGELVLSNTIVLNDPLIAFATSNCNSKPHGLLGSGFLRKHIVTIDQRTRLVSIQPNNQSVALTE